MTTFNNLDDAIENIKDNLKEIMGKQNAGMRVDAECPFCKKKTTLIVNGRGNGQCSICNNEIDIEWNAQ